MNRKFLLRVALLGLAGVGLYKFLNNKRGEQSGEVWTTANMPDLTGKVIIVTGANSGIGYEAAKEFARKGAQVILACRNLDKAQAALDTIVAELPEARAEILPLDLASLASVRQFADGFAARYDKLDVLVNNAGIMVPPYGKTAQGFESQFGVNHLGHFALTGLLLDRIFATPGSRIVTVSSVMHRAGAIDFDDLQWESRSYSANAAYGQSKLANLLFTYELQRKLDAADKQTIAAAAHPGWTATSLQQHSSMASFGSRFLAQSPPMGALPTLYAATSPDVHGGGYYGPGGLMEMRGYPKEVKSNDKSHDEAVAAQLWDVSEALTGVAY